MPFIPVANVAQVEMRYLWDSQQVENTLYYQFAGSIAFADLVDLTEHLYDWWDTSLKPIQSAACALREVYARDISSEFGIAYARVSSPPEPGTNLSPTLPNNVTVAIGFRALQVGRSFRGRNYSVGMCEGDVTGNLIGGTYATDLQAAYSAMRASVQTIDWLWGIVSRYSGGAPRVAGVFSPVAVLGFTDGIVDSQRRRLPTRGT